MTKTEASIFIEKAHFAEIKCYLTLRVKGLEKILKASGVLSTVLYLLGSLSNISDAEFIFPTLNISRETHEISTINKNLYKHYKQEFLQQFYI
jgi:hypothetical protein